VARFSFGRSTQERRIIAELGRLRPSPPAGALAAESRIGEQADGGFDALAPLLVRSVIGKFGDEPESAAGGEFEARYGVRGRGVSATIYCRWIEPQPGTVWNRR
jgi:hypothetical protein